MKVSLPVASFLTKTGYRKVTRRGFRRLLPLSGSEGKGQGYQGLLAHAGQGRMPRPASNIREYYVVGEEEEG